LPQCRNSLIIRIGSGWPTRACQQPVVCAGTHRWYNRQCVHMFNMGRCGAGRFVSGRFCPLLSLLPHLPPLSQLSLWPSLPSSHQWLHCPCLFPLTPRPIYRRSCLQGRLLPFGGDSYPVCLPAPLPAVLSIVLMRHGNAYICLFTL
jgi:hypothetical protein